MEALLGSLAQLGPALGSVVVIGIVCWKLLDMFSKHGDALSMVSKNMQAHTEALITISHNVETNTKATEKMVEIIEKKLG